MFIKIIGKPKKDLSIRTVKKAAQFYGDYLLGQKLAQKINLTIEFERFKKGSNEYAFCDWTDDNHKSREFLITMDVNLSKKESLLALAHEMVHLKQYAKGELKDIFRPMRMTKWLGENYDLEEIDYWEQPWEIEAYGREKGLYVKFISQSNVDDDAL